MQATDTCESSAEYGEAVPFAYDRCHRATLCTGLWTRSSIIMPNVMLLTATRVQQPYKWSYEVTATF